MNLCSFNSICIPLMLPNMPLILFFNIRRTVEGYFQIFFSFILGKRAFMMLLMSHNSSQVHISLTLSLAIRPWDVGTQPSKSSNGRALIFFKKPEGWAWTNIFRLGNFMAELRQYQVRSCQSQPPYFNIYESLWDLGTPNNFYHFHQLGIVFLSIYMSSFFSWLLF